ncbi:MAG: acyl carrier protein [Clostridiales bacterium]|nr:acyl carrier protein [Clostridiales bacterium]
MLEFIRDTIFQITGKSGITYDTDFIQDLALNSFDVMNIVCVFEEHFDITVPTRDVWKLRQVKDVIAYLNQMGIAHP